MSNAINSIVRGMYLGLGFSITTILIFSAFELVLSPHLKEIKENEDRERIIVQTGKLEILPIDADLAEGGLVAKLKISNNSDKYASSFILETEVFDNNGLFLGECMTTTLRNLKPGDIEYAQVFCREKLSSQYKDADLQAVRFKFTR